MQNIKNIKEVLEQKNQEFHNSDKFLGKDLLTLANKLNGSRNIMFHSHLEQYVVLAETEFPKVFTGYENRVAQYASSFYKADREYEVVDKIVKNKGNYYLIIKDENNYYDIIKRQESEHLTESYCYAFNNEKIDSLQKDDKIKAGEILYKSTSFDNKDNYGYGLNANCCYMVCNETTEDAIEVSQSLANRMSNYYLTDIEVSLNTNDILLNLYGDNNNFKAFPNVGESTKGKVLVSRRRLFYENALFDLKTEKLREINYLTDTVFYDKGVVVDMDIYCNKSLTQLDDIFFGQVKEILTQQSEFYMQLKEKLSIIMEDKNNTYSDDIAFLYKKAKEYLLVDDETTENKWDKDGIFDNLVINFKVMRKDALKIGSKVCGRFGNKGVISKILPDDQMPVAENGKRAEVILNALGVVNRLNSGQLFEMEINFISDNIVEKSKEFKTNEEKYEYILDYINTVNPEQAKTLREYNEKNKSIEEFLDEVYNGKGIYIHQPPFWNNVNIDELTKIYEKYDWIKPYKVTINGKEIENRLIIAEEYFLKLKHQPSTKFSVRSTSYLNSKDIPSKNTNYSKKQALYSTTPIRLGEMEQSNLLMTQAPDQLKRLTSMYASSKENREHTVKSLLTTENVFDIEEIETIDVENNNRKILNIFLKNMGLELED